MKKWIAQMALGIASLHNMGIIHRDIKPENVLVDRHDNIRIFDYGTAYIHDKPVRRGKKYSKELVGTRQYLAPEYLSGKTYGLAVDYWALGCTVFDLLAGDVSFRFPPRLSCLGVEWALMRIHRSCLQMMIGCGSIWSGTPSRRVSRTSAGDGRNSPKLRRTCCLGCARFIPHV